MSSLPELDAHKTRMIVATSLYKQHDNYQVGGRKEVVGRPLKTFSLSSSPGDRG